MYLLFIRSKTGLSSFLAFFRANVDSTVSTIFNQNFDPLNQIPTSPAILTKIERGYTSSPKAGNTAIFNDLSFSESSDIGGSASLVCSDNIVTTMQVGSKKIQLC